MAGGRKYAGRDKKRFPGNVCVKKVFTSFAVGSVVNLLIHPVGAVIIGCLAGALSVVGYRYLSVNIF